MRILLTLLFIMGSTFAFGQSNYEVFDSSNKVKIKSRSASEWVDATKGMSLSLLDSVYVDNRSSIRIIDLRSNEVYSVDTKGSYRVKDIRDYARQQSAKLVKAVYAQLVDGESEEESMKMVGATMRGDVESFEQNLAMAIISGCKGLNSSAIVQDSDLQFKQYTIDNEVYFSITNNTPKGFCVNVVLCDRNMSKVALCYVINPAECEYPYIYLKSGQTIELPSWRFAAPSGEEEYMLIATESLYDTTHLNYILQRMTLDDAIYKEVDVLAELIMVKATL